MKSAFEYRAYEVSKEGGFYVAKSLDGEPGQLVSKYLLRVLRSIDVLWDSLSSGQVPHWFATFVKGNILHCDLDLFAESVAPSLPAECADDLGGKVHHFFPGTAKAAVRIAAAA